MAHRLLASALFANRWSHRKGAGLTARVSVREREHKSKSEQTAQLDTKSDWLAALVAMVAALRTNANRRGVSFITNETVHGVRTGGQGVACGALLSHTGCLSSRVLHSQYVFDHSPKEGPQPEKAFVRRIPPSATQGSASTPVCFSA